MSKHVNGVMVMSWVSLVIHLRIPSPVDSGATISIRISQ